MAFGTVEKAIQDIKDGKFVVVADDESRENEGDLICAAQLVTTDMVNFMLRAKGMICVALEPERVASLGLTLQARENTDQMRTAFTVSVDAGPQYGVTTGISASDRAASIRVVADPTKGPADIRTPGHIHPLRARTGGVLQRVGHTEAAVDLCRLAGLTPAGVVCEILDDEGHAMRRDALDRYSAANQLTFITVADLVSYRLATERLVHREAEARLPLDIGAHDWRIYGYSNVVDNHEHVAITYGDIAAADSVLVRIHSKCLTGDVFHSRRCDCGWQLHKAMEAIVADGAGVIVYLDQEGRGIGLINKLKAYELQDEGHDTVEANEKLGFAPDLRNYGIGAQILLDLGLRRIRILTNNPKKVVGLGGYDLEIVDRVHLAAPTTEENAGYLDAKRDKLGHLFAT